MNFIIPLRLTILIALFIVPAVALWAEERPIVASRQKIAAAVERGINLVEKSARSYPTHRKCFACHHQTLPLLALSEARQAQVKTDEKLTGEILEFVVTSFR